MPFMSAARSARSGQCFKSQIRRTRFQSRPFSSSRTYQESFYTKARKALGETKIEWYTIPTGLGIAFLGFRQLYKQKDVKMEAEEGDSEDVPKRERIRPTGPWQVQVMSTLPLKAASRLWGRFNELDIPYPLRVPGFKLYSWIFGVSLDEVAEDDLHVYPNLAAFFYRQLKPGVRPLDPNPNALLSPSDGRVLQFGSIQSGEVEQVKGMTYSLDALLGTSPGPTPNKFIKEPGGGKKRQKKRTGETEIHQADEDFAVVNGISYTLPHLFSGPETPKNKSLKDQSTPTQKASEAEVSADLARGSKPWYSQLTQENQTSLYYAVIYLAPGDYHRFHSPTAWVAEKRRHFAGELYSVSPYLQRTLPGLFVLNERVVILGRWRHGFFSMIPVGATNVGSIKINFDRELRTNSLTTDTAADKAAAEAAARGDRYTGYDEATYENASPVLHGHPLRRGEEMGGFQLGSTIVLVFEAPKGQRPSLDEGWMDEKRKGGWTWNIQNGQKVKMGQALGWVDDA